MRRPAAARTPVRGAAAAVAVAVTVMLAGCGTSRHPGTRSANQAHPLPGSTTPTPTARPRPRPRPSLAKPQAPFAVGERVLRLVDHSRTVAFPGRARQPRVLVTIVRYPAAAGGTLRGELPGAPALRSGAPYPLVVFGHGFAVTPAIYAPLLRAWARAGYVVAAPIFPLENADAPGGPNEADLVNQPADMSLVITRLLAMSRAAHGPLSGLIDPRQVAVSGQSDGGDTALTAAYDQRFRDRRIKAAIILSGQEMPGGGGYTFPAPSPPLLATQGLADPVNLPATTYAFFGRAHRPKFLLELPGAAHLPPYTDEEPQLSIVERVSVAFLDRYLKDQRPALRQMVTAGNRRGLARLLADP